MNKKDFYDARLDALAEKIKNQKIKAQLLLEKSEKLKIGAENLIELVSKDLKQEGKNLK